MDQVDQEDWTCDDEAFLQDVMEFRELDRERCQSMQDFRSVRNARNGEKVRLLVEHPFKNEEWTIYGPAPEPGWYYLHCRAHIYEEWRAWEEVRHESEFESI